MPAFYLFRRILSSIGKSPLELQLIELGEKTLRASEFRIVDVDVDVHPGLKSVIRLFIEAHSLKGTSIGDCERASRSLEPAIEAARLVHGPYELEVSSPGLERRLRLLADFEGGVGKQMELRLSEKQEGVGMKLKGTLLSIVKGPESTRLVFGVNGQEKTVLLSNIRRASLVWPVKAEN